MTSVCLLMALAAATAPADGLPAAPVTALDFAPDGKTVVVATPHEVAELSWPDLALRRKLTAELAHVHDLAFAPSGKQLAIAGGKPGESGRVVLLSWPDAMVQRQIDAGRDVIYRAAWHPGGNAIFLASADKSVHGLSLTGEKRIVFEEHSAAVTAAAIVPASDGVQLATAGRDQTIRLWEISQPARSLRSFDNHTGAVHELALRPVSDDGPPVIASAGADRTVRFWQPTIGRMLRFSRLASPPLAICWSKDGERLAAACQDGHVRIIELQTARPLADLPAVDGWAYSIVPSPDGQSLLVGGENGQLKIVPLH